MCELAWFRLSYLIYPSSLPSYLLLLLLIMLDLLLLLMYHPIHAHPLSWTSWREEDRIHACMHDAYGIQISVIITRIGAGGLLTVN